MITKFKIFENLDKEPEVGDYILLKDNDWFFLEGHHSANIIGVITQLIPFNTIRAVFADKETKFHSNWIKYISKNRKDLEEILKAKKYNL